MTRQVPVGLHDEMKGMATVAFQARAGRRCPILAALLNDDSYLAAAPVLHRLVIPIAVAAGVLAGLADGGNQSYIANLVLLGTVMGLGILSGRWPCTP